MSNISLAEQVNSVTATLTQDIKANKLDIPSPPDILVQLRRLANDPNTRARDFADVIKRDANITARLIKVANSVLFSSRFPVETIDGAVTRLGQKKLQSLVTGLAIAQQLIKSKTNGLEEFCTHSWVMSNRVAVLSYILAQHKSDIDPEQALLAGMVHNIGVLPLVMKLNTIDALKSNPKIMRLVADVVIPKLYKQAGQLIMKNWHFPDDITQTVAYHDDLANCNEGKIELSDVIKVAFTLSSLDLPFTLEDEPESLAVSSVFRKFWSGWASSVLELNEHEESIQQMQYEISH